jgi:hypothetical protein
MCETANKFMKQMSSVGAFCFMWNNVVDHKINICWEFLFQCLLNITTSVLFIINIVCHCSIIVSIYVVMGIIQKHFPLEINTNNFYILEKQLL